MLAGQWRGCALFLCRNIAPVLDKVPHRYEIMAQRKAVENLSDLMINGKVLAKLGGKLALATERMQ